VDAQDDGVLRPAVPRELDEAPGGYVLEPLVAETND
jgi:hypothetical protein